MKNLISGFIVIMFAILINLGCSQFGTNTNSNNTEPNKTPSNNSNDNNSMTSSDSNQKSNSGDLTGEYAVKGKTPKGDDYANDLTVSKHNDVYQFDWESPSGTLSGVAVQGGYLVAVALSSGCGAAVYKITGNGLEGKLAIWGYNRLATQTATLVSQTKTSGVFDLQETNSDGTTKFKLTLKEADGFYQLTYQTAAGSYGGKGVRDGDYIAAGAGNRNCAYAVYTFENDTLRGIWGTIGSPQYGTETATRK